MNIAIVGNDAKFCLLLQELLEQQNHKVTLVPDPGRALAKMLADPVHLIILDGLPSAQASAEFVRSLRGHAKTQRLPVLSVNVKAKPREVVALLDAGADDFLVKPFHGQVFLARVRALLRRRIWGGESFEETPSTTLRAGNMELRLLERRALLAGEPLPLTRLEFDLLAFLMRHKEQALKRKEILDAVWNYPQGVETRTLDKHVESLRRKLEGVGPQIETVHGVGYRLTVPSSAFAADSKVA